MALIVAMVVMTLVCQCCGAPPWRNWTPQAILYLKGSQGQRSDLERNGRDEGDTLFKVDHKHRSEGLKMSFTSPSLVELLQRYADEERGSPVSYPEERKLNWDYV